MPQLANISHGSIQSYTGTSIPTDYKFVCWVGDVNEKELVQSVFDEGREIIQIDIPHVNNYIYLTRPVKMEFTIKNKGEIK